MHNAARIQKTIVGIPPAAKPTKPATTKRTARIVRTRCMMIPPIVSAAAGRVRLDTARFGNVGVDLDVVGMAAVVELPFVAFAQLLIELLDQPVDACIGLIA